MQAEAQEEIKKQAESYLRQQREQKEVISKLQVILFPIYSLFRKSCLFISYIEITFPLLFPGIRKRNTFACGNIKVQAGMLFHNDSFKFICYSLMLFNCLFSDPLVQEDARDNLVTSEKKVRELEARLQDEQLVSVNNQKVPSSVHIRLE